MADENLHVVSIHDDFYRDSFGKVIFIVANIYVAICILLGISFYMHSQKPAPVTFAVGTDWRVMPEIPLDQPYLTTPDMLQWVGETLPKTFMLDFLHYNDQLKEYSRYFTQNGWKVFLNQLNIYANYNTIQNSKLFLNATPAGAPFVLNAGLLSGRYGWWVQIPINLIYTGSVRSRAQSLTLQVLVVRVSTLNNLTGIGIENVIVVQGTGEGTPGTGLSDG
jgi:intracellular multiplication protein IcmL